MATVIDALMVTLGLDPKAFKKGAKEAEDAQGKLNKTVAKGQTDAEKAGKKAADQMGKFRNEVLRTAAAFVGLNAIKSFVANVTQSDAALGRMATNLGDSIQDLSVWKGAADAAGSSGDSLANSLSGIVQTITRFSLTGEGGDSLKYFRALKINVSDAHGKMRDIKDITLDASAALNKLTPQQAQVMGKGMGFSESDVNFLRQGPTVVKQFYDEMAKANTRTPEDAKNAMARQKAWALLLATFNRLATDILNKVSPALVGLANFIRDHAGVAATLIGGIAVAMTTLSAIRFVGLISQLGQLAGALRGVGAAAAVAGAAESAAGAAGAVGGAGGLASMGLASRLGLYGAAAAGAYQIFKLGSALKDWWDIKHRKGVTLTPDAAARQSAGAAPTGGAGMADKQAYLASLEKQFGLPAGLLDADWLQESGRGRNKLNKKSGAKGDFQFMDKTAKEYGLVDPMDFGQSAIAAARKFRDLLKEYKGNLPMALAAYNDGQGNLAKTGLGGAPMETQNYWRSVMANMRGGGGAQVAGDTTTSTTHIGAITIQTAATDAQGIHRDLRSTLKQRSVAVQADQGLS